MSKHAPKPVTMPLLEIRGAESSIITCNKVSYGSGASANMAQPHQRAYFCALCGAWHTTMRAATRTRRTR